MADLNLFDVLPAPSDDVVVHAPDGEWTGARLRERVDELASAYDIPPGTAVGRPPPNGSSSRSS